MKTAAEDLSTPVGTRVRYLGSVPKYGTEGVIVLTECGYYRWRDDLGKVWNGNESSLEIIEPTITLELTRDEAEVLDIVLGDCIIGSFTNSPRKHTNAIHDKLDKLMGSPEPNNAIQRLLVEINGVSFRDYPTLAPQYVGHTYKGESCGTCKHTYIDAGEDPCASCCHGNKGELSYFTQKEGS